MLSYMHMLMLRISPVYFSLIHSHTQVNVWMYVCVSGWQATAAVSGPEPVVVSVLLNKWTEIGSSRQEKDNM